jgi:hypothetical protein
MSGGSGSGGGFVPTGPIGSGSRKPGSDDPCEIRITLPLSAIQRANLTGLAKGDKLPVELLATRGTDTVIVRNPKRNNGVVGAVAYKDVQALIDCIHEGNEYQAEVLEHSATSVKVRITRK